MPIVRRIVLVAVAALLMTAAPAETARCDGSELCPGICSGDTCITGGSPVWVCKMSASTCSQYSCQDCN